jgi:hypothetical protein
MKNVYFPKGVHSGKHFRRASWLIGPLAIVELVQIIQE